MCGRGDTSLKRFVDCSNGSVLIPFVAGLVVFMLAGAVAVDYGSALRAKSVAQAAADAAALAGASIRGATFSERIALAENIFQYNVAGTDAIISPTMTMENEFEVVAVTANVSVPTMLAKVVGRNTIDFAITSKAAMPAFEGEIVLVLDYSSSMTDSAGNGKDKWEAMRDAAKDLIDRLLNGKPNPELKVGLVPFARNVYLSLPGEHVIGGTAGTTWTNCTNDRRYPYVAQDSTPLPSNDDTRWGRTDGNNVIASDEYDDSTNYPSRNLVVRRSATITMRSRISLRQWSRIRERTFQRACHSAGMVHSRNAPFSEGAAYGEGEQNDHPVVGWR